MSLSLPFSPLNLTSNLVFPPFFCHFIEKSSLNIFWIDEETRSHVRMATASTDLPAPRFFVNSLYPVGRTSSYYSVSSCEHEYRFHGRAQERSNDEAETMIYVCTRCGTIEKR